MRAILLSVFVLAGCATNAAKLAEKPPFKTYSSTKPVQDIAGCIKDTGAALEIDQRSTHTMVTNRNMTGAILINWKITPEGAGSKIEVWRTSSLTPGITLAERCY